MRIVNKNPCTRVRFTNIFETTLDGLQFRHALSDGLQVDTASQREACSSQGIQGLELTDKRKINRRFFATPIEEEALSGRLWHQLFNLQIGAAPANRNDVEAS